MELRNIAINFRSLSYATSARLKKAAVLIASRRVRRQKSEKATDFLDADEEDWDLEYDLLAPNQVAIADDTIALQQFGEVIFCAPQEDILEGEYSRTAPGIPCQPWRLQDSTDHLGAKSSVNSFERNIEQRRKFMGTG